MTSNGFILPSITNIHAKLSCYKTQRKTIQLILVVGVVDVFSSSFPAQVNAVYKV